jgi:hypothetical protein
MLVWIETKLTAEVGLALCFAWYHDCARLMVVGRNAAVVGNAASQV